mgnify:CR=1 FL=1
MGQFGTGRVAAFSVSRAVGDLALGAVAVDTFDVRLDVDAVETDGPVQTAGADVGFGLAVAPHDGRESGPIFGALNAGVDDLANSGGLGRLDHIAVLANAVFGWGRVGDEHKGVGACKGCSKVVRLVIVAGTHLNRQTGDIAGRPGEADD